MTHMELVGYSSSFIEAKLCEEGVGDNKDRILNLGGNTLVVVPLV